MALGKGPAAQTIRGPFEKSVDWRQCTAVMHREAVTVVPSCNGGGYVVVGVCGCACALVCMQFLCFLGFNSCEVCSGWVTYCHRCLTCFKGSCVYAPR
jgi:hypothetical protein